MIEIKHRMTGRVLYAAAVETIAEAVTKAIAENADLRNANLRNAHLSYADLRYAHLRNADLSYAHLSYANLRNAHLSYADLRNAHLSSADLRHANLRNADLSYADLRSAHLSYADLSSANLRYVKGFGPESIGLPPADQSLLRKVCETVVYEPTSLAQGKFHTCDTVHCLAGWSVHHSRMAGYALEKLTSSDTAGRILIPAAQHLFYEMDNAEVLEWCKGQLDELTSLGAR